MEFVENRDDIFDNVEMFLEGLELNSDFEKEKTVQLIKQSKTFLVIDTEEVLIFVPSTFVGYKESFIENYKGKLKEDETNPVITSILGSTPKVDKTLDELFLDFCDEIEVNRNDVGVSRDYWIIKNI